MTAYETYFVQTMKWFKEMDIDVMVHGSTLLNILRNGTVEPRMQRVKDEYVLVTTDKELNLAIKAEDFTDMIYKDMKFHFPYFRTINNKLPNSGIFFAQQKEKLVNPQTEWDIEPGFTFLTRLWQGATTRFKYHGEDIAILIPNKFVNDEWDEVEVHGITVSTPAHTEEYLTYYYGDWETEDLDWHWSKSPNRISFNELLTRKEI